MDNTRGKKVSQVANPLLPCFFMTNIKKTSIVTSYTDVKTIL